MTASNSMYNLPRFSSVLLVLLIHTKDLTALPYEIQPALPQSHLANTSPLNDNPADAPSIENRNLNLSDTNPSVRSLLELPATNLSADASLPALRTLPSSVPNPPQVEDVAARSALNLEVPLPPASALNLGEAGPAERYDSAVINASLLLQGGSPTALRNAFESLPSNASNVEQRSLNLNSSAALEVAPRIANESQVEVRSLSAEAVNATDLALRSVEHASPVSNNDAAAAVPQLTANVEPVGERVMEVVNLDLATSSAVNVPYINVFAVDNLGF